MVYISRDCLMVVVRRYRVVINIRCCFFLLPRATGRHSTGRQGPQQPLSLGYAVEKQEDIMACTPTFCDCQAASWTQLSCLAGKVALVRCTSDTTDEATVQTSAQFRTMGTQTTRHTSHTIHHTPHTHSRRHARMTKPRAGAPQTVHLPRRNSAELVSPPLRGA